MKNIKMINGVPVTIEMNKTGQISKVSISDKYIITPAQDEYKVVFMQKGDTRVFVSSNCYSQRYDGESDIDFIINGLCHDGYFPECPEYMAIRKQAHEEKEKLLEQQSIAHRKKETSIYWTTRELFGYDSLFDNNVGGCESDFYGVCAWELGDQDIPCVFCHKNSWVENLSHIPTLKERKEIERLHR